MQIQPRWGYPPPLGNSGRPRTNIVLSDATSPSKSGPNRAETTQDRLTLASADIGQLEPTPGQSWPNHTANFGPEVFQMWG